MKKIYIPSKKYIYLIILQTEWEMLQIFWSKFLSLGGGGVHIWIECFQNVFPVVAIQRKTFLDFVHIHGIDLSLTLVFPKKMEIFIAAFQNNFGRMFFNISLARLP
jgi:hypothetical protein